MGEWIDAIMEALGNLGGSIGEGAGSLWDSAAGAAGQLGQGAANFGGNLWQGAMQNPWGAIGTLGQLGGQGAQMFMGQGGDQGGMDMGAMTQMQQPGGPTPQQLRRNIGDVQSRGLSGASPDFMASMNGMTPSEMDQMLGIRSGGQGAT